MPLVGRAIPTRTIPVLRRQVQTGEIIRTTDTDLEATLTDDLAPSLAAIVVLVTVKPF